MKKEISNKLIIGISIVAVFLFILMITIGWFVGTFNTLVTAEQDILTQWSNVKTEYQRRADLFYNLVEVTKSYRNYEQETLTMVVDARSGTFGNNIDDEMQTMNELDGVFARMALLVEAYPELKANEQHNRLMDEITTTEDRIQIARSDYNGLVRSYNIYVSRFPTRILAGMYGYEKEQLFQNQRGTDSIEIDLK